MGFHVDPQQYRFIKSPIYVILSDMWGVKGSIYLYKHTVKKTLNYVSVIFLPS